MSDGVAGHMTNPTANGDLLHYSAVASEPQEPASKAAATEVASSYSLIRAAAEVGGVAGSAWQLKQ